MTGEEIYLIRVTYRINQETLAAQAGVSRSLVSQLENDYRVSDEAREKIIAAAKNLVTQNPPRRQRRSPQKSAA